MLLLNMTPRIITYFLCGMRHPTTGLSEDDLSRLTGSSSSTASCSHSSSSNSSSSSTSPTSTPARIEQQQQQQPLHVADAEKDSSAHDAEQFKNLKNSSTNNSAHFNSSYLPEFIDPLDWQKSRKRKDRLDSTSSSTQDRKLIRSNSEEQLPQTQQQQQQQKEQKELKEQKEQRKQHQEQPQQHQHHQEQPKDDAEHKSSSNVRRVASEDFKKLHYSAFDFDSASADTDAVLDPRSAKAAAFNGGDENDAYAANRQTPQQQQQQQQQQPTQYEASHARDMTRRTRYETSPARSHRHSPNRLGSAAKYHRDSDDSECEHERRRSSERFSKTRAPPGRKASGVMKKSGKYLPTKMRGDENAYKYDLSALKYERRGFVSKLVSGERATSAPATAPVADHNDNNLIDFHIMRNSNGQNEAAVAATKKNAAECNSNKSNNSSTNNTTTTTSAEALPWCKADQSEPVLSRRYATVRHRPADCIDTAAKLSKVMPYPQQFHKQSPTQLLAATEDDDEGIDTYRAFTSLENLKTREVMHQLMPAMMSFQSPEERLKQVNKRLTALKKKLVQFEQGFETRMGYRPSQAEKQNDKYMKNVMAELSKLRKEKHELRVDPLGALGFKVSGGMDATKKLDKMRDTLDEIEQNLSDKREDSNRSETLDELTADQLLQEKTAVQHGLLYFESQYGRPSTKDERDAARPLYDRYRQLKRMVSRSIAISGCASAGVSELPTILEHEAMVFESMPQHYSSNNSTESSSNTPTSESQPTNTNTTTASSSATNNASSDDSETTTTTGNVDVATAATGTGPTSTSSFENISALNIEQLWEQLDKTREQKKLLKRTIREFETVFEEQNGRKMLKSDRKLIEETYAQYKEQKAKTRLLQALIKKHISR